MFYSLSFMSFIGPSVFENGVTWASARYSSCFVAFVGG